LSYIEHQVRQHEMECRHVSAHPNRLGAFECLAIGADRLAQLALLPENVRDRPAELDEGGSVIQLIEQRKGFPSVLHRLFGPAEESAALREARSRVGG
jgi:hypothetical protein